MLFVNEMSECDTVNNVNTQPMPSVVTKDAYHTAWHTIQVISQSPLPSIQDFTGVILNSLRQKKKFAVYTQLKSTLQLVQYSYNFPGVWDA